MITYRVGETREDLAEGTFTEIDSAYGHREAATEFVRTHEEGEETFEVFVCRADQPDLVFRYRFTLDRQPTIRLTETEKL